MPSNGRRSGVTAFAAGSHAQSDHRGEGSCRDGQEREAGPQPDGRNLSVAAGERERGHGRLPLRVYGDLAFGRHADRILAGGQQGLILVRGFLRLC